MKNSGKPKGEDRGDRIRIDCDDRLRGPLLSNHALEYFSLNAPAQVAAPA